MDGRTVVFVGAGVALGLLAWKLSSAASGAVKTVLEYGGAAVDMADKVISTPVLVVGDAVGLPRTNETECQKAIREGRTWDASFVCPAGDFLGYVFNW